MLSINFSQIERLQEAMKAYEGNVEAAINEVLHGEASELLKDEIKRLMPVSGRAWKGKSTAAKNANSLTAIHGNLSTTIKTTKKYQYLYFPDDGSNTKRHAGNQQFFRRAGEEKINEIADRCITRLAGGLQNL